MSAKKHVGLTKSNSDGGAMLPACLDSNDLAASQVVGEFFRTRGVQAIAFPSAIPGFDGRNLVAFRDVVPAPRIILVNRDQILKELRRLAERMRQ